MTDSPERRWLEPAEEAPRDEQLVVLCVVAGRALAIDHEERNGAVRRAQLLLATGGDPRRGLELNGRAVSALAADLDGAELRAELARALDELLPHVVGLERMTEALEVLRAEPDLAWQTLALTILAEALESDD